MKSLLLATVAAVAVGSSAMAADLAPYPVEPVPVYLPFTWTGLYVGISVGGGVGRTTASTDVDLFRVEEYDPYPTPKTESCCREGPDLHDIFDGPDLNIDLREWWAGGGIVNIHGGYLWQSSAFVVGVQVDAALADISGEGKLSAGFLNLANADIHANTQMDGLVEARLKAGVAVDRALFYGTLGVAAVDVENSFGFNTRIEEEFNFGRTFKTDDWQTGFTVGGGIQYAVTDNWVLGLDYQHIFLDDTDLKGRIDLRDLEEQVSLKQPREVVRALDKIDIPVDFENGFDLLEVTLAYKF